jgi:hypothetical protein
VIEKDLFQGMFGGILAVMVSSGWGRQNPATGYDHCITASTFLPFSGVFSPAPVRTLSPGFILFLFYLTKLNE